MKGIALIRRQIGHLDSVWFLMADDTVVSPFLPLSLTRSPSLSISSSWVLLVHFHPLPGAHLLSRQMRGEITRNGWNRGAKRKKKNTPDYSNKWFLLEAEQDVFTRVRPRIAVESFPFHQGEMRKSRCSNKCFPCSYHAEPFFFFILRAQRHNSKNAKETAGILSQYPVPATCHKSPFRSISSTLIAGAFNAPPATCDIAITSAWDLARQKWSYLKWTPVGRRARLSLTGSRRLHEGWRKVGWWWC